MANRWGNNGNSVRLYFWGAPKSLQMVIAAMELKDAYSLEKEMLTHSSTLAWRIPWMEEPGGLQSTGSQRVGHDGVTSLSLSLYLEREVYISTHGSR